MSTPPLGRRGLAVRAAQQGLAAARAGHRPAACPYGPDRPYSRRAWVRGYCAGLAQAGQVMPSTVADATDEDAAAPDASDTGGVPPA